VIGQLLFRVVALLVALTAAASALTTDKVNEQFDASGGGRLVVDVDFGMIEVSAGADNQIDVDAERRIDFNDEAREKEYVTSAPISVTHEGNVTTIRARRQSDFHEWHGSGHMTMDAHYNVKVPRSFDADLRTGGGSVSAADLIGTVKADTSGGKLHFKQLRGALTGKTSGGSVDVHACKGPLNVQTSGGSIEAAGGSGRIDARTSGGSISVQDFSGDTNVETSGGGLKLMNINGSISGRTSGGSVRASLAAPVPGDVKLETSAGSIDIAVPPNAGFNVDAEASAGRVKTDLPFVGERNDNDSLHGRINGGGKSLQLRSGAGSILIRAAGSESA
jgi:hypothetical protein